MRNKIATALLLMLLSLQAAANNMWDNYKPSYNVLVRLESTNLPIVFINTDGQIIDRDERITARMQVLWNPGGLCYADTVAHPGQPVDYDGYIGLKWRGNSSFTLSEKKPMSVRPLDKPLEQGGKKKKVSLLGMGSDNDWALLAPFSDKTMMRDVLTMQLARGYFAYVPHMRFCEVVMDGTYYGVYILSERVGKGKHRLNLDDPELVDGEIDGDYHVEVDRPDEDYYYTSTYRPRRSSGSSIYGRTITYQYKNPEGEDFESLPEGTQDAINGAIKAMEDAFAATNYADPDNGYRSQIDPMSFADYILATELSGNVDGYRLSTNLYRYSKKKAAKLGTDTRWRTSLWDFNIAYGNANYNNGDRTDLWMYKLNDRSTSDEQLVPFYWQRLMQDTAFTRQLGERWNHYRHHAYTTAHIMAAIDSMALELTSGGAVKRNQQAWANISRYVWPNAYVGSTFDEEVTYLKTWIEDRLAWMDVQLVGHEIAPLAAGDVNRDGVVDASDVTALVGMLLGTTPADAETADLTGDAVLDASDVSALVSIILQGDGQQD